MSSLYKTKHALEILQADGVAGLSRSLRRQVSRRLRGGTWSGYSDEANVLAQSYDFTPKDLELSRCLQRDNCDFIQIKSITWFIPDFFHAYYGGIYTILRFADHMKKEHGVRSQFALVGACSESDISARIGQAFPALANEPVRKVGIQAVMDHLEPTDAAIATLWNTAYFVLKFNKTRRKFYFLQDHEPLFYPAGTSHALVEASYRFGFYGLTNTPSLKTIYTEQYGGEAEYFVPCIDTQRIYPDPERKSTKPYRLFFYGRPEHPRNAFELGSTTLRKLKDSMGDDVEIVSAGANWIPSDYGFKGKVNNLGLLSLEETVKLYRQCDAGLVLMFTRHPSYLPFELMASGCLVITNYNPATTWFLRDGENCLLSEASASFLSERIEFGLRNTALRERIVKDSIQEIRSKYSNWPKQIEKIYAYMCSPKRTEFLA